MKKAYNIWVAVEIDDAVIDHDPALLGVLFTEMTRTLVICDPSLRRGMTMEDVVVIPHSSEDGTWDKRSSRTWMASEEAGHMLRKPSPATIPITGLVWGGESGDN